MIPAPQIQITEGPGISDDQTGKRVIHVLPPNALEAARRHPLVPADKGCSDPAVELPSVVELPLGPPAAGLEIDGVVPHGQLDRGEAHRRIAGMLAGLEVELVAVPRADDMALRAEAQPPAGLVGRDHLLDPIEDLSLAHRAAVVGTDVAVGDEPL